MGAGGCSECLLDVCVNQVQCILPSGSKVHMLVKVWEHSLHVGLVKVPSNNKNALRVCGLHVADGTVENTQGLFTVSAGWNVNSNNGDAGEFPGQVEGSASHNHKLYVHTAMTGDQSSVVTPAVVSVDANTAPPGFTCESMAPVGPECC